MVQQIKYKKKLKKRKKANKSHFIFQRLNKHLNRSNKHVIYKQKKKYIIVAMKKTSKESESFKKREGLR